MKNLAITRKKLLCQTQGAAARPQLPPARMPMQCTVEDGRRGQLERTSKFSPRYGRGSIDEVISHLLTAHVRDASMYDLQCQVKGL